MNEQQMKSIINTNYLSPWGDEGTIDVFLAPPAHLPFKPSPKKPKASFLPLRHTESQVQQQVKKPLMNLDIYPKQREKTQIRSYLQRRQRKQLSQVSVKQDNHLKLPPLNKVYDSIDYAVLSQETNHFNDDLQLFRKYGEHRRSGQEEGKVERSISYGGAPHHQESNKKVEALEMIPALQVGPLRLKGKKYSFEQKLGSQRKFSAQQYKYIPSQPNLTPHYLLFGHSKQEVLKKVLQQISQRSK